MIKIRDIVSTRKTNTESEILYYFDLEEVNGKK